MAAHPGAGAGATPALGARLRRAEAEFEELQAPPRVATTPYGRAIAATVREVLLDLGGQLDSDRDRARAALRQLLGACASSKAMRSMQT